MGLGRTDLGGLGTLPGSPGVEQRREELEEEMGEGGTIFLGPGVEFSREFDRALPCL